MVWRGRKHGIIDKIYGRAYCGVSSVCLEICAAERKELASPTVATDANVMYHSPRDHDIASKKCSS